MTDGRTPERLRAHYEVERDLAGQLMDADAEKRMALYGQVYDTLYRSLPDHPQLTNRQDDPGIRIAGLRRLVSRFVNSNSTLLEIGAGDCALCLSFADEVRNVWAVDVSDEISASTQSRPVNFQLYLSDGTSMPCPPEQVDLALSNQLMEHLHPEDALAQLHNIHQALKPGGAYLCLTPSKWTGPHDVSRYFSDVPEGLHLKEYDYGYLAALLREAGFGKLRAIISLGPLGALRLPVWLLQPVDLIFRLCPMALRRRVRDWGVIERLAGVIILAQRPV